MLLLDESESFADKSHSASFSSENEAQGGDPAVWQCTPPPSTSPSAETPAHPSSSQPASRPHSRPASQSPSPPSALTGTKKRSSKPAHMRRNIRKLLREHQLEAVTKAAQQEELERRRRLEQQRKPDFPGPLLPEYTTGDVTKHVSASSASVASQQEVKLTRQEVIRVHSSSAGIREDESKTYEPASATTEHAHKTDVIDLSSGEDDATVHVSSESTNEEEESEPSGAHANDALNQADAQGRVLVNLNHPDTDRDIFLLPQLARAVKPHQIGGIRFLYDNLVESVERFGSSSGFGCILAHSMGLGKTLQVISFIDVLFRHTQAHTVLAIVPVNTLQNWLSEFNMWVPPPDALPPDTDPALVRPRTFKVHILNDEHKNTATRAKVVEDWARDGGVLLMGYEMYRLLSLKKSFVAGRRKKSKKTAGPVVIDLDEEDRQQELLKGIEQALARPGPDVVICDEGHRIKNCHASTSLALKNIRSRRRVVLTGYPLQNNLIEYWCMVDFVRPDFLGTRQEFSNMFERPILNGQCVDSTPQDMQLMRYRSHVLHSLLEGFVQRRGHDVLKDQLLSKEEHVILVRLSPLQRALYTEFMNRFREAGNSGWLSLNPLKAFCVCCKIWNHPDVLYEALQKENLASDQDLDLDDITSTGHARCPTTPNQKPKNLDNPNPIGGLSLNQLQEKANQVITYEWAKDIMCDYKPGMLENSAKMVLLFHLIEESVRKGDKLLVFSQSLSTLTVIEDFLAKRPVPPSPKATNKDRPNQNWVRNLNYYRLDGSTTASERERLINQFNDPSNTSAWVFLLSTRAGCLGVNLIGANRVVVFDASWNPCHDAQAVCRVYRYGQRKPCHIYRLVCDFTLEKKIYDRQISKQGMSDRVVDDLNPVLTFTRREVESLLHFVEEELDPSLVQLRPQDNMESVLRKALHLHSHLITKQPFPHESLLMDRRELKLSNAEKKAAKKGYEEEKRASVPYTRPSYAHYYPASDQSLTNIPAFSQRNWRPPTHSEEKPVASVRLVQSTPVPGGGQVSAGSAPGNKSSRSSLGGFPMKCLQKAGVFVQKIVTTTDIVIPGTNSSTDVQARINTGETIDIIRGTKGTYIRTSDGRIFAIRAANKAKTVEEGTTAPPKDLQAPPQEVSTNGSNGCESPDRKQLVPSRLMPRPLSPDSPDLIKELQHYTGGTGAGGSAGCGVQPERAAESSGSNLPSTKLVQTNGSSGSSFTSGNVSHRDASVTNVMQPNMDATAAQDLRTGSKRKASTPTLDERANVVSPDTDSSPDAQARIDDAETIDVIKGVKGTYIRTSDGRIFAVRAANNDKTGEEGTTAPPNDLQAPPQEVSTDGSNGCESPDRKQLVPSRSMPRPLSPDSPDLIKELQHYTGGTGAGGSAGCGVQPERAAESSGSNLPSTKLVQTNGSSGSSFTSGNVSHRDASVTNVMQPNMDATAAQDLRTGSKRKASTPTLDERASKQLCAGIHSSAPLTSHGFPFTGGYGLPPLGLSSAMLGGSLGHPLFMGAGSRYFQPPHTQLGDPTYMYPDLFGLGGGSPVPTSSSSSSATTTTAPAVSSSSSSSSSLPGALPPFMLSPSMAGMAGMLPPGFPLPYSASLASLYTGSMLPGGLPGLAATPGPAGASFLSQYPPTAATRSSSSSPSSFSSSARSEGHRGPVLVNGGDVSSVSSSDDDDDDDIIEVSGQ
ncbi:helicase ARIP4-like isoform X2 [Embiotoca jacksoni]|uniref:helicase ARIP4-like isoform X2 n=1 Tax=Embiotoca jacksoni TaxID=100190 RepID=UPI00370380B6